MPGRRPTPVVDLYPDQPGPKQSPFGLGGVGRLFVFASNRNQCSFLVDDLPELAALDRVFPMGYSTLFVVQKVAAFRLGDDGAVLEDLEIPSVLRMQEQYAVLPHPQALLIGGGGLEQIEGDFARARARAVEACPKARAVVVGVVTDVLSWH